MTPELLQLIEDYGDKSFDCGDWRDGCSPSYEEVYAADVKAHDALVAKIEELGRELREAQQERDTFKEAKVGLAEYARLLEIGEYKPAYVAKLEQQLRTSEQERERLQSALVLAKEALKNAINEDPFDSDHRRICKVALVAIAKLETQ